MKIELKSGQRVWLAKFTGLVVKSSKFSSTTISSHGGGGSIYRGSGTIYAPTITGMAADQTEFFLKSASGIEKGFTLALRGLHVREGHRVTVVWGAAPGAVQGPYTLVVNHDTDELIELCDDVDFMEPYALSKYLRGRHLKPYWIGICGTITIIGAVIMAGALGPLGFLVGAVIFGFIGLILMIPIGNILGSFTIGAELQEIVTDLREKQRLFALDEIADELHV